MWIAAFSAHIIRIQGLTIQFQPGDGDLDTGGLVTLAARVSFAAAAVSCPGSRPMAKSTAVNFQISGSWADSVDLRGP
jgi:hypothetical protein